MRRDLAEDLAGPCHEWKVWTVVLTLGLLPTGIMVLWSWLGGI